MVKIGNFTVSTLILHRTKSNEVRNLLVNATTRRNDENAVIGVVGVVRMSDKFNLDPSLLASTSLTTVHYSQLCRRKM
jgi:hypothetical protein